MCACGAFKLLHVQEGNHSRKAVGKKTCKRCQRSLDKTAFCTNLRASDGLYTQCRSCVSQKVGIAGNIIENNLLCTVRIFACDTGYAEHHAFGVKPVSNKFV